MNLTLELAKVARYLLAFGNAKTDSNEKVFNEIIEPLYHSMDSVSSDLIKLYSPIMSGLDDLHATFVNDFKEEFHDLRINFSYIKSTFNWKEWARTINESSIEAETFKKPHFEYRIRRLKARYMRKHWPEYKMLYDEFCKMRASSRIQRVHVDAAAKALFAKYSDREDKFAKQVRMLAFVIRDIVGRSQNRFDWSKKSKTDMIAHDFIDINGEELELDKALRSRPIDLDDLEWVFLKLQMLFNLAEVVRSAIEEINKSTEAMIYAYEKLKLTVISEHRLPKLPRID